MKLQVKIGGDPQNCGFSGWLPLSPKAVALLPLRGIDFPLGAQKILFPDSMPYRLGWPVLIHNPNSEATAKKTPCVTRSKDYARNPTPGVRNGFRPSAIFSLPYMLCFGGVIGPDKRRCQCYQAARTKVVSRQKKESAVKKRTSAWDGFHSLIAGSACCQP